MATYTKETALFDPGAISSAIGGKQDAGNYAIRDELTAISNSINDRIGIAETDISSIENQMASYASRSDIESVQTYINTYIGENGAIAIDGQAMIIRQGNYSVVITPDGLFFRQGENDVAHMTSNNLFITNAEVTTNLIIGNFAFVPREGRFTLMKIKTGV